ncbi:FMN-binding negative transcriptional regulator [Dactylosporangium vinaceum]|uniref:FMN-binding negative transcriptional regulator n=1 Tax=Dactylosporangium vinaceum TaxID=53362 RepID=A0ABV5MS86_9ACTN|nr:FMN-binding negative transcriptional regulator [Dactylosporangium vinaceum]UAC00204.1 FMN-binding negative transcriptional regulator [Dactylosporangium vinaceum]
MYVPPLYRPADLTVQHQLIERHRFGQLTTIIDGRLHGVHIPFVLDPQHGPYGRLRAHLAKANPVVAALRAGTAAMVAFTGPHSYICPDDYATDPHFPTWNYAAVHVHGRPSLLTGAEELRQLTDLIAAEEARRLPKTPWTLARVPDELIAQYRTMIVAFELPIDTIEGIFKLGQNKEPSDVDAQIAALRSRGEPDTAGIAALLETHNAAALDEHRAAREGAR